MYVRYLFFDVATRLGAKPVDAVRFIGRHRVLAYSYGTVVSNLIEVDAKFIRDREAVYNIISKQLEDGED